jgi:hypothetical protein
VFGYEGLYEVSDIGRVRSVDRTITCANRWGGETTRRKNGKILSVCKSNSGYPCVGLWKNNRGTTREVHRLVLESFIGPCPDGMECRHLNGDPGNNNIKNLCWGTRSENFIDKSVHGNARKLKPADVGFIKHWLDGGFSNSEIAKSFGVSTANIWSIRTGRSWGWLTGIEVAA